MTLSTFNSDVETRAGAQRPPASERACLFAGIATFLVLTLSAIVVNHFPPFATRPDLAAAAQLPTSPGFYIAYDHGGIDDYTIYNNLNNSIDPIRRADVLFLGDSRVTHAMRAEVLDPFFHQRGLTYYVMSFEFAESSLFPQAIIRKFDLHPKWLIINADPFFTGIASPMATRVMSDVPFGAWKFALETSFSLSARRGLHTLLPYLPYAFSFREIPDDILYRSYDNGTMFLAAYDHEHAYVPHTVPPGDLHVARDFQSEMTRRGAQIILMGIPPDEPTVARTIAHALGVPAVTPQPPNMVTLDKSHLDDASSVAFCKAMVKELDPVMKPTSVP